MRVKTKKLNINHLIVHLILLAGVAVVVFPFLWMILTSFKTSGEAMKIPPTIFPDVAVDCKHLNGKNDTWTGTVNFTGTVYY